MADVRFLCVCQDVDRAEQLAETFEASGLSVASGDEDADVTILLWSESAAQSRPFLRAASAACPDTTLIASLTPGVIHPNVFDLSAWDSSKERALVRAAHKLTSHSDAEETLRLPLAPEPVAEPVIAQAPRHPTTSGWRDVDPQPPYRRIGAALALGLIAFVGVQLRPAPAPYAMSVAEAPIVIAEAAAYEPAAGSIESIEFEQQAEPVASPLGLLEPASADDRTPPPYRSWDHESRAEAAPLEFTAAAATGLDASFKRATFASTTLELDSGWHTASYGVP